MQLQIIQAICGWTTGPRPFTLNPMENVLGTNIGSNLSRVINSRPGFSLTGNIYLTDFIDVIIITALLYSVFLLFKRTRSFLILLGLVIILGIYAFAKFFNLYLTSIALQYFFGIFIVIFAIIFQQEIRRFFEWVGATGSHRLKTTPLAPKSPSTSEILQACAKMAQTKVGALIVIRGKYPLEEFIEGGVRLDGNISEEIITSIFDPHSGGHDGALIVSNGRISRFGAHLPLSNNFREIGKHGTRHSAALGLSEITDALCIVVSEEKGTISVCKDGRLKKLENFTDLEKELDKFVREKFLTGKPSLLREIFGKDIGLKTAAFGSASLIWFFSAYQAGLVEKTYTIPVNFLKVPDYVLIESSEPKTVTITVRGRGDMAFSGIDAADFQLDIDAASIENGVNKFNLSPSMIKQPLNLSIVSLDPPDVLLSAKRYSAVTVPVTAQTKGSPAKGFKLKNITVTPETLNLLVPDGTTPPDQIPTDVIDLTGQKSTFIISANLILPEGIQTDIPESSVASVAITIEKP